MRPRIGGIRLKLRLITIRRRGGAVTERSGLDGRGDSETERSCWSVATTRQQKLGNGNAGSHRTSRRRRV
jgi:hypothetical protein